MRAVASRCCFTAGRDDVCFVGWDGLGWWCRGVCLQMRKVNKGHIVTIASGAGHIGINKLTDCTPFLFFPVCPPFLWMQSVTAPPQCSSYLHLMVVVVRDVVSTRM